MCIRDSQETDATYTANAAAQKDRLATKVDVRSMKLHRVGTCLLYTSDAADERSSVDLGGRRIIKKKKK